MQPKEQPKGAAKSSPSNDLDARQKKWSTTSMRHAVWQRTTKIMIHFKIEFFDQKRFWFWIFWFKSFDVWIDHTTWPTPLRETILGKLILVRLIYYSSPSALSATGREWCEEHADELIGSLNGAHIGSSWLIASNPDRLNARCHSRLGSRGSIEWFD